MYTTTALLLTLATIGNALPNVARSASKVTSKAYTDKFDSPAQQALGLAPDANLVNGTAGGALYYNSFSYVNQAVTGATLPAPSTPDVIAGGPLQMEQQGQYAFSRLSSSVKYFTLSSIYYACAADSQAPVGLPLTCTIQFAGVRTDGSTVIQELVYNPGDLPVGAGFAFATFPAGIWYDLVRVDIQLIQAGGSATAALPLFDSVSYIATLSS